MGDYFIPIAITVYLFCALLFDFGIFIIDYTFSKDNIFHIKRAINSSNSTKWYKYLYIIFPVLFIILYTHAFLGIVSDLFCGLCAIVMIGQPLVMILAIIHIAKLWKRKMENNGK